MHICKIIGNVHLYIRYHRNKKNCHQLPSQSYSVAGLLEAFTMVSLRKLTGSQTTRPKTTHPTTTRPRQPASRHLAPCYISPNGHFAPQTACPMDILPHGQFAPRTFRPRDISPHGQLTPRTTRPMVCMYTVKKNSENFRNFSFLSVPKDSVC